MSKRESKKEAILLAGMGVMKSNGYNGTSVKDIVDAAGVPKGSFYNYFASKEQFALDAIEHAANEARKYAQGVLQAANKTPGERLESFFNAGIECATSQEFSEGCFLGNMCQEMADISDCMRKTLDQNLNRQTGLIADVITEGQNDKSFGFAGDAQIAAEFLFNAWEGALMRAKAAKTCQPLQAFMTMFKSTLQTS